VLVSRNVSHVVSALQCIVCLDIFLADQISCRSYVDSGNRMQSLAVSGFSLFTMAAFPISWSI